MSTRNAPGSGDSVTITARQRFTDARHRRHEASAPGPMCRVVADFIAEDSTADADAYPSLTASVPRGDTTGVYAPAELRCLCGFLSATNKISSGRHTAEVQQRIAFCGSRPHSLTFMFVLLQKFKHRVPTRIDSLPKLQVRG